MSDSPVKRSLRKGSLEAMRSLDPERLMALSGSVADNLYTMSEFKSAHILESYVARTDEVQTGAIIKQALAAGKRVIVPVTDPAAPRLTFSEILGFGELSPGPFGILEPRKELIRPLRLSEADLALVPLVAWDEKGNRLGHGKGYFDRALTEFGRGVKTVGLGLESQRVPRIPAEPHDHALDMVVTEERVVRCNPIGRA